VKEFKFDSFADEFGILADDMIRHVIQTMMDSFKFDYKNKYIQSKEGVSPEIMEMSKILSDQLEMISDCVQKSRFIIIWRKLISELDEFLAKQKQICFRDIEAFLNSTFLKFTLKPLNFIPKTMKLQ
jgi:hypothetical protein